MRSISRIIYLSILFLLLCTTTYPVNYYVDKNASGSNNGISWTNAWESFSAINWSSLSPGDTLFISGGTDSTIYYETLNVGADGTAENRITIITGKYAPNSTGHSGRVIIDGGGTRTNSISIDGDDYVTVKGFECREGTRGIGVYGTTYNVIIDSCFVYDFHGQSGIMLNGTYSSTNMDVWGTRNCTVRNCRIVSFEDKAAQTDCFYIQCAINTTIEGNYVHNRNSSMVNSHSDGLQTNYIRGLKLIDNVIICDSGVQGMPVITRAENNYDYADSVIIYNNYLYHGGLWFVNNTPWLNIIDQQQNWCGDPNMEPPTIIAHNTIVSHGPFIYAVWFERYQDPQVRMYNNLIAQYGDGLDYGAYWHGAFRNSSNALEVDSVTGGLYYSQYEDFNCMNTVTGNGNTGTCYSFNSWVNTYGGTGIEADPLFVDYIGYGTDEGSLTGELQPNSPAINAGEDIQAIVEGMGLPWTDINGNPRDNTPTVGAWEYDAGPDLTPPKVTSATLLDSVTLVVNFSEALDATMAEDENNYSITNNINILNASLSGSKVTLQTSPHSPGSYLVTVVNVEDLAGNPIDLGNNTAEYILLPADTLVKLPVQNVEGAIQEPEHTPLKTIDGLGALDGDPDSRWAAQPMPEDLTFDLGSINTVCKTKLSFYRWNTGRVYTYSIAISSDHNNWLNIVPQSTSALNEEWTIDEFSPINARYVWVHFINNNQSDWAGLWEGEIWGFVTSDVDPINNGLPNEFSLHQNYPNPFNPSTAIRFSIPIDQPVRISIYNVLGELLAELTNQEYDAGTYTIDFDGSSLSSGIYFYTIETPEFIETKKMILMK